MLLLYRRKRNCRTSERFYKRTFQTGSRIAYDKSDRGSIQISDDIADGHLYLCQFPFLFFPGSGTEEKSVCKAEPGHVLLHFLAYVVMYLKTEDETLRRMLLVFYMGQVVFSCFTFISTGLFTGMCQDFW